MKKLQEKNKKSLTVVLVFASIFFVAWAALFALAGCLRGTFGVEFVEFMKTHLTNFINAVTFKTPDIFTSIYVVSALGVSALLLIIGLIVTIAKKYPKGLFFVIPLILFTVPLAEALASLNYTSAAEFGS